jgi:hypothetical protein
MGFRFSSFWSELTITVLIRITTTTTIIIYFDLFMTMI